MIKTQTNEFVTVTDSQRAWEAVHRTNQICGPQELRLQGLPAVTRWRCAIGAYTDESALVETQRSWRKGNVVTIVAVGTIPTDTTVRITHAHRYMEGYLRTDTQLEIPRHTVLREQVAIGSVGLVGSWSDYRVIAQPSDLLGTADGWQPLGSAHKPGEIQRWSSMPLALMFRRDEKTVVEIGLGIDLWRWQRGLLESDNHGEFRLTRIPGGFEFERCITRAAGDFSPVPRQYSFSSYIAWSLPSVKLPVVDGDPCPPVWTADGGMNFRETHAALQRCGRNAILDIDFGQIPWIPALCRTVETVPCGEGRPCFVANGTLKRLKRIVRQIQALELPALPVQFRGLDPGLCDNGSHLSRRGKRPHWDLPAIVDFCAWTRRILGKERTIVYGRGGMTSPSMNNLFSVTDDAEELYEWIG